MDASSSKSAEASEPRVISPSALNSLTLLPIIFPALTLELESPARDPALLVAVKPALAINSASPSIDTD